MKNERNKEIMMSEIAEMDKECTKSPLADKVRLAERCCPRSYRDGNLPMQRYYKGQWYDCDYKGGYNQISSEAFEQSVTNSLIHFYNLKGAITAGLRRDIVDILQTNDFCGLSGQRYQMPCIISTGADASRILLMKNGYVSVDKIMDTMKAGRPRPKAKDATPDLFSTWKKDYDYVSTAKCPNFLEFLKEIQPKKENREALQMMAGLCLVPDCAYEKVFVLCGVAGSGKTTFLKVLKAMLGKNCYCSIPLAKMPDPSNGTLLTEKLANISSDMSIEAENGHVEAFLKAVASGEEIPVEQPDGRGIRMANVMARCIFETNELPRFADKSNGIWSHLYPIPFNQVFRGTAKQNPRLADELIENELPGILNWALEGLFKLRAQKTFQQGRDSEAALINCRMVCDPAGAFLMENTEVNLDKRIVASNLHFDYTLWAKENGVQAVSETELMKTVLRMYPNAYVYKTSRAYWMKGIGYRKKR